MTTLTKEQIEQNAAAYIAAKTGKPWQWQSLAGRWIEAKEYDIETALLKEGICRPAPAAPEPKPWDFNSRPREVVWVYRKGHISDCMITTWGDDCVVIDGKDARVKVTYAALSEEWLRRDGSPCGVTPP